jgi:hypothetical protein
MTDEHDDLLDSRITALDRLLTAQRTDDARALELVAVANQRALDLATQQMDSRLEKLNEFRGALADAQNTMMPRAEVKLLIDAMDGRIDRLQEGLNGLNQSVIALASTLKGESSGSSANRRATDRNRNMVLGVIAAAVAVITLFFGVKSQHPVVQLPTPTTVR